jgi:hypothetical protein
MSEEEVHDTRDEKIVYSQPHDSCFDKDKDKDNKEEGEITSSML